MNAPFRPLPPTLESAARRLKDTVRSACDRTVESLGLAALSAASVLQRDGLLTAQVELNRKTAVFALAFNGALDDRLLRELRLNATSGTAGVAAAGAASWEGLSLVDDREVEAQVAAERFGLSIAAHCEWELRDLEGYIGPILVAAGIRRGDGARNPLRPEVIGHAVIQAIESVSQRPEVRRVLEAEFLRTLEAILPQAYAAVIAELRAAGHKPAGFRFRGAGAAPPATAPSRTAGLATVHTDEAGHAAPPTTAAPFAATGATGGPSAHGDLGSTAGPPSGQAPTGPGRGAASGADSHGRPGVPMGHVDADLMTLMRRLAGSVRSGWGPLSSGFGEFGATGANSVPPEAWSEEGVRLAAPNLIRAHREELRSVSHGSLDHMVIDVVGSLFDQILSDPKVPPQMARQIGRLQLPVLRAALGDPSFFSSRKHPVRRFINRLASLATAFEDLEAEDGQLFLQRVRELVQEIVEGDFDQAVVYDSRLAELELFVAEQARREIAEQGDAARLLADKEAELRVQQRYVKQLQGDLAGFELPDFLRDFLAEVWGPMLLTLSHTDGVDGDRFRRLRTTGRDLSMSVQPKGTPEQRKVFLQRLPTLMRELNEGVDLIGMPEAARKAFFGALLPAHAASLKGEALSTLDYNLLARRIEKVFEAPIPTAADCPPTHDGPAATEEALLPRITPEEAQRIGLVDEAAIDWNGQVDIDLSEEAPPTEADLTIDGLPAPEPAEPTLGQSLADHVQVGFAYQMHLDGEWQKVKLAHVNPARSFFVFTRGKRHKQTISLTRRMLLRLCESHRLRAFESAYLLERATARARRQLARLKPAA